MPWTVADLKLEDSTNNDNAAPYLDGAVSQVGQFDQIRFSQAIFARLSSGEVAQARAQLDRYRPAMEGAARAAQQPNFIRTEDWRWGSQWQYKGEPYLYLVRLLVLDAEVEAEAGNGKRCLDRLLQARKVTWLIGSDPHLAAVTAALGCENLVQAATRRSALRLNRKNQPFAMLAKVLEAPVPYRMLGKAAQGEAYLQLADLRNREHWRGLVDEYSMSGQELRDAVKEVGPAPESAAGSAEAVATHLRVWASVGQAIKENPDDPIAMAKAMNAVACPIDLLPTARTMVRNEAFRVLHLALIQVLDFERRNGKRPKSLEELGTVASDPYLPSRKIQYRDLGKELTLYTVGPDQQDDKGNIARVTAKVSGYDIGLHLDGTNYSILTLQ